MKSIFNKIKRKENGFYAALYRIGAVILYFSIPVNRITKPVFSFLYILHVSIREAWKIFIKTIYFEPLFRSQCASVGRQFQMERLPYIVGFGKIIIGNKSYFSGKPSFSFSCKLHDEPEVIIGDNTFVGHNTTFIASQKISIGSHCLIAGNVEIRDNDGHPFDFMARRNNLPPLPESVKPVRIGDDVWIGTGVLILKGVVIGDRSVIAAHSVVTADIPPDSVAAGVPARVIRTLGDSQKEQAAHGS